MTTHSNRSCPICGKSDSVKVYGKQNYLVSTGGVWSLIFHCKKCDFNFRDFGRPLSEVPSHFKVAPYSKDEVEQRWLKRREGFYRFLLDLLSRPSQDKSLLDIGCAFGHFLDCAAERGYRPFGTEVSEEMAQLLRKRREYPVSSRPLHDLQLSEKQFDVVALIDSFYYFEDPLETMRCCYNLLKPGGELIMRVTNRNGLASLYKLLSSCCKFWQRGIVEMPFWTTDDAISCHSRRSLTNVMEKTDFRIKTLICIEKGKEIESLGMKSFYFLTNLLALLTNEKICLTPGIICLATKE